MLLLGENSYNYMNFGQIANSSSLSASVTVNDVP